MKNNTYMINDRNPITNQNIYNIQNNALNYNVIKADDFIGKSGIRNNTVGKYISPFLYNDKINTNTWNEESIKPKRLNFDNTRNKEEIVIYYNIENKSEMVFAT
jgi:hypothetical protein